MTSSGTATMPSPWCVIGCARSRAERTPSGRKKGQGVPGLRLARAPEAAAARRAAWATAGLRRAGLGSGRLARQEPFPLGALARKLARAAHGLRLLADPFLRRFLVIIPQFHLAENTLALHLLLQRLEGLINVIVANLNQQAVCSYCA